MPNNGWNTVTAAADPKSRRLGSFGVRSSSVRSSLRLTQRATPNSSRRSRLPHSTASTENSNGPHYASKARFLELGTTCIWPRSIFCILPESLRVIGDANCPFVKPVRWWSRNRVTRDTPSQPSSGACVSDICRPIVRWIRDSAISTGRKTPHRIQVGILVENPRSKKTRFRK